ncbi:hypothetical protein [Saccharothrix australiensis]|uniref:Pyrrolidone-carboxylate peptidase n=1 Tax=Saccharothrix australiensis TaxID=2072 RepID=A0A495VQZ6_9PSEU|nr:hypothetical protein [Saccharothrix australiensis]RKT51712.1 pyrrolidone-carboxylate peptidase [Saccharothrix australiensis]
MIRRLRTVAVPVIGVALVGVVLLGSPGVASGQGSAGRGGAAGPGRPCFDVTAPLTVEEQRLDDAPAPGQPAAGPELVRLGGFDDDVRRFEDRLCAGLPRSEAEAFVARAGRQLWRAAVERARSTAAWDAYDDRPLYWARLLLTRAVRQWAPRRYPLPDAERARLVRRLDDAARGVDDVGSRPGARRVAVTGFDPFQLSGAAVRRSNPSGAAALRLDGREFDTPRGRVVVEAAVLPVSWESFDGGIVERFYGGVLTGGRAPDALVTVSQGRPGRFDVERWAARWRGGAPDNNDVAAHGVVPDAPGWPQPAHEFIETTLPAQRMVDAGTGPYPVLFNRSFCEWPPGSTPGVGAPDCRTDEPTPGAVAAVGSGGDYLSNESMYRANRLRLGLSATAAGGHLHTPVLGLPADPAALTDPAFEADRRRVVDQVAALIAVV